MAINLKQVEHQTIAHPVRSSLSGDSHRNYLHNQQFPWSSIVGSKRRARQAQHQAFIDQHVSFSNEQSDKNPQLMLHGSKGDRRTREAPTKFVKQCIEKGQRFNNSIDQRILRQLCHAEHEPSKYDVYQLNTMFGLPHEKHTLTNLSQ